LLWILGSVALFGIVVDPLHGGLVIACILTMLASAYGGWEFNWKEAIINSIVLTAATVALFYYGLGLPFRLWPWSY
jgi:hypothetical protein